MVMGGKKKLSLKQMERAQDKKDEEDAKKEKKKEKAGPPKEKKLLSIAVPDTRDQKIIGELKRMRVLTPYSVASRFNIRISAAKDFLEQLEEQGTIQTVSSSHNIKIYKVD